MAIPDQFRGVPNECLIYSLEQVQLKNVFHQQLLRAVNQTRIWYELKIQLIWSGPLLVVMIEGPVHKPWLIALTVCRSITRDIPKERDNRSSDVVERTTFRLVARR